MNATNNNPAASQHERTQILIGPEGLSRLRKAHILVAGLGGVGGIAAEALVRAGVGQITLLDHDTVSLSNLNRQIIALHSTLQRQKAELVAERLHDINPEVVTTVLTDFLRPENAGTLVADTPYDYILDCIDSIACKAALVAAAQNARCPIVSSMGAGGRLDPTRVKIAKLNQTHSCALAREMRKSLKRLAANLNYPVVFSDEPAVVKGLPHEPVSGPAGRPRAVNGTISYMPAIFGLTLAGHTIRELLSEIPS